MVSFLSNINGAVKLELTQAQGLNIQAEHQNSKSRGNSEKACALEVT